MMPIHHEPPGRHRCVLPLSVGINAEDAKVAIEDAWTAPFPLVQGSEPRAHEWGYNVVGGVILGHVRFLVAEAVADVREHVVHLLTKRREDHDYDDGDQDQDERVLHHALPTLGALKQLVQLVPERARGSEDSCVAPEAPRIGLINLSQIGIAS